jgi:hypothetical protein
MTPQEETKTPKIFLANAFSLQMIPQIEATVKIRKITVEEAKRILQNGFINAIGHDATAVILSKLLGMQIGMNRISIVLNPGDKIIVFQLMTGRLPTASELSEAQLKEIIDSGKYEFKLVEVLEVLNAQ